MEEIEVLITGLAHLGEGMGRYEGKVVFLPFVIPGEKVRARIVEDKGDFLRGELIEILEPSPHRIEPVCPLFRSCGGCSFQHLDYSQQVRAKEEVVKEQLRRIGKIAEVEGVVKATIPAERPFYYRNRADFSITRTGALGFRKRQSHRFIYVEHCWIMHERINEFLTILQGKKPKKKSHNLTVRYGVNTGRFLIQPEMDTTEIETGQEFFTERILNKEFLISAPSFFQVNTYQAEKMVQIVLNHLRDEEVVVDAYAGVGTFTYFLAQRARKVIAIEESKSACDDARINLEGLGNVEYINHKTEIALPKIEGQIDAIVLDPPRVGCVREVLEAIASKGIKKVIYVSCEPSTLARDLAILVGKGYSLLEVQPIDMFPQTYHIENIALLQRAS